MLSRFVAAMAGSPMKNIFSGPGPNSGVYDSATDTGYYGEVSTDDLITGDALATAISLSSGTSQNSTGGWLKFYIGPGADCNVYGRDGGTPVAYVIFVAKKTFRYNLSWANINSARAVDGSGTAATIGGYDYKVRLLTGADADPQTIAPTWACADNAGLGSEWNDLMYRVHADTPNCTDPTEGASVSSGTQHGGPQSGADWGSLSNADMVLGGASNGSISWAQEVAQADSGKRIQRGRYGVATLATDTNTTTANTFGWRPVLELT